MNIVIIGAGQVGAYIASVLSKEGHSVVLVDEDGVRLQLASINLDIATRTGSGTDWQLLDDLLETAPDVFIALTGEDEVNFTACAIAKHLGYPRTMARVKDSRYLNRTRLDFGRIFSVDAFLGPELLVANDILKQLLHPGSLALEHFAHGAVVLRTLKVPLSWSKGEVSLKDLELPLGVIAGLIKREGCPIIFPHGTDRILAGDEVTFIGEADVIAEMHRFLGFPQAPIGIVSIVGGSLTAVNLADLLIRREIPVRIFEKNYNRCIELSEKFSKCQILHLDGTSRDALKEEKIGSSDVLISCTNSDEVNLLASLQAKDLGCQDVILLLSDLTSMPMYEKLGLGHVVSPRISTANQVLSQIFSEKAASLITLYNNEAQVIEIIVSIDSKIVGIPLADLNLIFPKDFLIAMIQNRGRIMTARGDRILCPGDTVIVLTTPREREELERIF